MILSFKDFINEGIFNKLPDFGITGKVKKITFTINGDKIEALSGAWLGLEYSPLEGEDEDDAKIANSFYFKTDKNNTSLLKKNGISGIKSIDPDKEIITFDKNDGGTIDCKFSVKYFSKQKANMQDKDEYTTWRL